MTQELLTSAVAELWPELPSQRWDWYQLRADVHRDRGATDLAAADALRAAFLAPEESGTDATGNLG